MKRWIFFLALGLSAEPLTLRRALEIVSEANPDAQAARLRAAESEARARIAGSALGPQLNGQMSFSYQVSNLAGIGVAGIGVPDRVGPYRVFDVRPRLTQSVLDLSTKSAHRAAQLRTEETKQDAAGVEERARMAVVESYVAALEADSRRRAAEARLESAKALLQQTKDAEQAGTSNKLDVARALQRVETESAAVILAARDKASWITQLRKILGMEQTGAVELQEAVYSKDDAAADVDRPEMRAMLARGKALEQELQKAKRERYPKISAFGDFGALGPLPDNTVSTYAVGVAVNVPIYTSGRIENEIKAAQLRLDQWEKEKRALALAIAQEVEQARTERDAARTAGAANARAAAAAREALELARLRYQAGLTTNLDVVTAQGNLAETEESEIRTRYEALLAAARLERARGNLMRFAAAL